MENNKKCFEGLFMWDYNEEAPVREMINFCKKNPNLKFYYVALDIGLLQIYCFAKSKKQVKNIVREYFNEEVPSICLKSHILEA